MTLFQTLRSNKIDKLGYFIFVGIMIVLPSVSVIASIIANVGN